MLTILPRDFQRELCPQIRTCWCHSPHASMYSSCAFTNVRHVNDCAHHSEGTKVLSSLAQGIDQQTLHSNHKVLSCRFKRAQSSTSRGWRAKNLKRIRKDSRTLNACVTLNALSLFARPCISTYLQVDGLQWHDQEIRFKVRRGLLGLVHWVSTLSMRTAQNQTSNADLRNCFWQHRHGFMLGFRFECTHVPPTQWSCLMRLHATATLHN